MASIDELVEHGIAVCDSSGVDCAEEDEAGSTSAPSNDELAEHRIAVCGLGGVDCAEEDEAGSTSAPSNEELAEHSIAVCDRRGVDCAEEDEAGSTSAPSNDELAEHSSAVCGRGGVDCAEEDEAGSTSAPSNDELAEHSIAVCDRGGVDCAEEDEAAIKSSCASRWFRSLKRAVTKPSRWVLKKLRRGSGKIESIDNLPLDTRDGSAELMSIANYPLDIRENIFGRLPLEKRFELKRLSKCSKVLIETDRFCSLWSQELFTAITFFVEGKKWRCMGYSLWSKVWTRLPNFACLPAPDANRFKEYLICGHGGLLCANVSKSPDEEVLVVFNLLTAERRQLPSLKYPRNPVLIHILVDFATNSYKVVAAGSSSSSGDGHLSRKVEVYDSLTLQWEEANDIPGSEEANGIPGSQFRLDEHQTGVCVDGILYFLASLDDRKSVLAFDVMKREWLKDRNCSVPEAKKIQLVESGGNVYLYSEQRNGRAVEHCIDELHFSRSNGKVVTQLKEVVRVKKAGQGIWSSLLDRIAGPPMYTLHPVYMCVPFGSWKLCIFNTNRCDGVIVDVKKRRLCEALQPLPVPLRCGDVFFSLNPMSFLLQPNFTSKP